MDAVANDVQPPTPLTRSSADECVSDPRRQAAEWGTQFRPARRSSTQQTRGIRSTLALARVAAPTVEAERNVGSSPVCEAASEVRPLAAVLRPAWRVSRLVHDVGRDELVEVLREPAARVAAVDDLSRLRRRRSLALAEEAGHMVHGGTGSFQPPHRHGRGAVAHPDAPHAPQSGSGGRSKDRAHTWRTRGAFPPESGNSRAIAQYVARRRTS